jgi:hypothetical protein
MTKGIVSLKKVVVFEAGNKASHKNLVPIAILKFEVTNYNKKIFLSELLL